MQNTQGVARFQAPHISQNNSNVWPSSHTSSESSHSEYDNSIPSREFYYTLYNQLIAMNPEYAQVPFDDFYKGCVQRHLLRVQRRKQALHSPTEEHSRQSLDEAQMNRSILGRWYKTPDESSKGVKGPEPMEITPTVELTTDGSRVPQLSENFVLASQDQERIPEPMANPSLASRDVKRDPDISENLTVAEHREERFNSSHSSPVKDSVANKSKGNENDQSYIASNSHSHTEESSVVDSNADTSVHSCGGNESLEQQNGKDNLSEKQRKMWCLSHSTRKQLEEKGPLKLKFQFRQPSPKNENNLRKLKESRRSRLSLKFIRGRQAYVRSRKASTENSADVGTEYKHMDKTANSSKLSLNKGDNSTSDLTLGSVISDISLQKEKSSEMDTSILNRSEHDKNEKENMAHSDNTVITMSNMERREGNFTLEGNLSASVSDSEKEVSTTMDASTNMDSESDDTHVENIKDGRADMRQGKEILDSNRGGIENEGPLSCVENLIESMPEDDVAQSGVKTVEESSGETDPVVENRTNAARRSSDNARLSESEENANGGEGTGEIVTEQGESAEQMEAVITEQEREIVVFEIQSNNERTNIDIMPDMLSVNSQVFFAIFHGRRLLCINTGSGQYFIMKELVNKCFKKFKQDHAHGYSRVYVAKMRDLKIPFVELTLYRKQVMEYLQTLHYKSPIISKHIGLIHISDAHRLYRFFHGVKSCVGICTYPYDLDKRVFDSRGSIVVYAEDHDDSGSDTDYEEYIECGTSPPTSQVTPSKENTNRLSTEEGSVGLAQDSSVVSYPSPSAKNRSPLGKHKFTYNKW